MFRNKSFLVTGGTGSFGNVMVKHLLSIGAREVIVLSRDESKQETMRHHYNNPSLKFIIGDVRDVDVTNRATSGVDYVFHAAALKQVPSCEFFPMEAVKTNVIGTENVIRSSIANHVKKVVFLSTDKAVYPINAMGISKAMAEKVVLSLSRPTIAGDTVVCCTRYGNVLASRGSVVPLFLGQCLAGKRLTVTDPNMTRFLMTLEDSVSLVMHAFENGNAGDVFIQKASSATVNSLAHAIKKLTNSKSEISIIGTRHGEKLYESLISREEMLRAEDLGGYYRIVSDNRELNYMLYTSEGESRISKLEDYTSHNAMRLNEDELVSLLKSLDLVKDALNV